LIQKNFIATDLLDAARDAIAMERAHGGQGLKDHKVQGALQKVKFGCGHVAPVV
jgi:hypothetical protein